MKKVLALLAFIWSFQIAEAQTVYNLDANDRVAPSFWTTSNLSSIPWTSINGTGTTGARPAASASNAGFLYFNTTTSAIERSTGSTWVEVSVSGGVDDGDKGDITVSSSGSVWELDAGSIVNADISGSAAIALSKLATDPLARANHTGTQAWSTLTSTPTTLSGYGITDAQPLDSDLTSIAALTTTSFGRGLLDDVDASAGRTSLGVVIGTDVQAYDADLTTWAGVTPGSGVATFLATPTIANLNSAVSDADLAVLAGNTFTSGQTITEAVGASALVLSGATQTSSYPVLTATQTWAAEGVVFTGLKLNITNTASANYSKLLDVQLGGTSVVRAQINWGIVQMEADNGFLCGNRGGNILGEFSAAIGLNSNGFIGFSNAYNNGLASNSDARLYRDSTAVLQQGADVNGSPVPQAYKAHDGITGSNIAGANLTTAGGLSTGTGRGGDRIEKTAESTTSGTTATSYTTREYHSAKWVTLNESTATTFCNIALASSKYVGARFICTVEATDGTDFQCQTAEITMDAVNKAGTVTVNLIQADNTAAASSGTLTTTYTGVVNGNSIDLKCNAVSSLSQNRLSIKWSALSVNTNATDTSATAGSIITPQ